MKNEFVPNSKYGTYQNLSHYYEQPILTMYMFWVLWISCKNITMNTSPIFITKTVKRDTSVCSYDCSNYYFEFETDDEDYIDEMTGEIIKGLRKYAPSKEHRPNPIVEMELFMDKDGILLSMYITSGSANEQTSAVPLEKQLVKMLKGKKFIYCANAGLDSLNIRNFNSMSGRSFIITQLLM